MKLGGWVEGNICQTPFFLYLTGQSHSGNVCHSGHIFLQNLKKSYKKRVSYFI
jgi:hypothetical protein